MSDNDKSFSKKLVVITGGSRGLGLAIAKRFIEQSARVVLLARKVEELEDAKKILTSAYPSCEVFTLSVDITVATDIERTFQKITSEIGDIHILVNNAGAILVAPYDSLVEEDFRAQMELHLFAIVRLTRLVVDHFRSTQCKGRIINICSLGGKVAVPHMLTYDTSKFALAGFSQGLTAELGPEGISITTVYPTVMRTGSPIQAVFKGDHEKEYMWFASSDNLPLLSADANSVAKKLVQSSLERRTELIPSFAAKLRLMAGVLFPQITDWTMKMISKRLPKGQSKTYKTGAQSETEFKQSTLYRRFQTKIESTQTELNQVAGANPEFNLGLKIRNK